MTTPVELRREANEADERAEESFRRSDTDGFLSQWASGMTASLKRAEADLIEAGGTAKFLALFTTEGEYVPARQIDGQWGARWMVLDASGRSTGTFLPVHPARRSTLANKGYVEGYVLRPAVAKIMGGGRGLSGAANCYVGVEPTDRPTDQPVEIITTDRWAD